MPTERPLADRMRPQAITDVAGQEQLLGPGRPLRQMLDSGDLPHLLFWGPPGTGKTTLARLIANATDAEFESLSAVLAGVRDIRNIVERARSRAECESRATLLFIDEVHRFNKAQQDALLPHLEDGTLGFVGATTENPAFALNNALLSRVSVFRLDSLGVDDICAVLRRALEDEQRGLGGFSLAISEGVLQRIAELSDGDARRALNVLEASARAAGSQGKTICPGDIDALLKDSPMRFDRGGDAFYDQISALHKSIRGSDPDAALYWLACMLEGGGDPLYIARRLVRIASEDIGNADPRGLTLALSAWDAFHRLGSPEGELALAQAAVFLACAAKSNAVEVAWGRARAVVSSGGTPDVPNHLRNAPTQLAKNLGHGRGYRYDHDEPAGHAAGQQYFPDSVIQQRLDTAFYEPVERGMEIKIREKLEQLRRSR